VILDPGRDCHNSDKPRAAVFFFFFVVFFLVVARLGRVGGTGRAWVPGPFFFVGFCFILFGVSFALKHFLPRSRRRYIQLVFLFFSVKFKESPAGGLQTIVSGLRVEAAVRIVLDEVVAAQELLAGWQSCA
jgi:hypothetical protein